MVAQQPHIAVADKVRDLAGPLCLHQGLELVDVEFVREGKWVLRIYIDRPGGVSLEDCQAVSRIVERALDVDDAIEQAYSLEVSSPGIERPLRTAEHFVRFAGEEVVVKTFAPLGVPPRRNFKGKLLGISESGEVGVEVEGKEHRIPLPSIARAHLSFDFSQDLKKKKPRD